MATATSDTAASLTGEQTFSSAPKAFAEDLRSAQAIIAGNHGLFRKLYDDNVRSLYILALRLTGSASEADDIVQEAFVRAYQKMDLFAGRSTLSSWLYRICINVGLEHLRRRKGGWEELNEQTCGAVEPDQKKLLLRRKLDRAIAHLPQGCRLVFVLHDVEGYNHKEIADRLNLAEGTSKSQLFKARALLRKILTGQEA